eukprot:scaffold36852_cov26-Tisochrysis_lutea.AAC.2
MGGAPVRDAIERVARLPMTGKGGEGGSGNAQGARGGLARRAGRSGCRGQGCSRGKTLCSERGRGRAMEGSRPGIVPPRLLQIFAASGCLPAALQCLRSARPCSTAGRR